MVFEESKGAGDTAMRHLPSRVVDRRVVSTENFVENHLASYPLPLFFTLFANSPLADGKPY